MRIHTDRLTETHVRCVATRLGLRFNRLTSHRSRKRLRAFDVILEGNGKFGGQYGNVNGRTALWDEWGMFLAGLYEKDLWTEAGKYKNGLYDSYDGFHFLTDGRFEDWKNVEIHKAHKWEYVGSFPTGGLVPGMAAAYSENKCGCGAVRREVTKRV